MLQNVESISEPAMTSDLPKYHDWLKDRILEEGSTRRLVANDLRRFASIKPAAPISPLFQPQHLAYAALTNAVLPLIMFKVVTGILNRLILLSLIVVLGSVAQERLRCKLTRDELTCTLLCMSISIFAAICL